MAIKNVKLKNGEDVLYPKTKISNILNEDGTTWKEKVVEANPSENSTADLTKVKIENIVYKMASQVEANPSGEATTDLTKIKIEDTIYRLASGSSGSSGGSGKLEILKPTLTYNPDLQGITIAGTLSEDEATKVQNGEIYGIAININGLEDFLGTCTYVGKELVDVGVYSYVYISNTLMSDFDSPISGRIALVIENKNVMGMFLQSLNTALIPPLPSDASNKTYVLKSVNGQLTWSE